MRKALSVILLSTITLWVYAQMEPKSLAIDWGMEIPKNESFIEGTIGADKDQLYVLSLNENYFLDIYSTKDLSKISHKQIIPPKNQNIKGVILTNKGLILLSQFYNNRFKINQLFAKHLTPNAITIGRSMNLGPLSLKRNDIQIGFKTYLSPDRSKILTYIPEGFDPKESMKFRLKVVDSDLNDVWERSITLPYLKKHVEILNLFVANDSYCYLSLKTDGQIKHFIFRHDIKQIKIEEKLDSEGKVVVQFDNRLTPISLPVNERQICNSQFQISPLTEDLIVMGFYAESKPKGITGSFYASIDRKEGAIKDQFINPFSAGEKSKNKIGDITGQAIGDLYKMGPIKICNDGGYVISLEEKWVNIQSNKNDFTFTYYRNDLFVVKLAPNGRPDWNKIIHKRQFGEDKLGGALFTNPALIDLTYRFDQNCKTLKQFSYGIEAVGDDVFVFYNASPKNFDETDISKYKALKSANKGLATYLKITSTGRIIKGKAFGDELKGTVVRPDCSIKLMDDTHIIIGENNGKSIMGKVNLGLQDL